MNDFIRQEFSRYNATVQEELILCLNRHGSLAPLLEMFDHHVGADLQQQAAGIHEILGQYGQVFFLTAVKSGATAKSIRMMSKHITNAPDRRPTPGAQMAPPTAQAPPTLQPRSPYAPPANNDPVLMIDVPGYKGPDRRRKSERRQAPEPDRRESVDLVYKNRRFGGNERRKQRRRAEDRVKTSDDK